MSNGYNPMRWDCDSRGCFNKKRRPKIEMFHDLFPGKISFGDIDAIVEINGHALILEWKSDRSDPTTGQRIMYSRLTANSPITVIEAFKGCGGWGRKPVGADQWTILMLTMSPPRNGWEKAGFLKLDSDEWEAERLRMSMTAKELAA